MKTSEPKKKAWAKPEVQILSVRKDTFSGSQPGNEKVPGYGTPPQVVG